MAETPQSKGGVAKLTVFTFAIMNVVAVVSLRGLPAEAEYGLSSIFFYIFAAVFFLIPVSLVAAELATGWPEKGGVFRWVGEAFGPEWAFLAMFMLFTEVSVWFPTALTFGAVSLAFIGPDQTYDQALSSNKIFVLCIVLAIYWLATIIAFRGVEAFSKVSKWGGMIGTIIPAIILIILGFCYLFSGQPVHIELSWGDVLPDFTNFSNIVLAASIFLFYAGMEMNAIHVKELDNASKSYPMAIAIASIGTVVIFVLGTLAIGFVIPQSEINLTQSLLVAYFDMFEWAGIGFLAPVMAICLAIGVLAGIITWVSGPSSGLLVVAKAGYLPRFWQYTNKHGMATHIMLVQGGIVTVLSVLFVVMPSVQATYQILSQLTVILYLIMYLLMFAAGIYLRFSQPNRPRPYRIPGGKYGMFVVAGIGFIGSLLAFLFSFIPPGQIEIGSPTEYVLILIALTIFFVILPFVIYHNRKPHWKADDTDFAPFTWELENTHPGIQNDSDTHTHKLSTKHFQWLHKKKAADTSTPPTEDKS
ncbi:putative glutamine/gamma-aminobutyrate antiporter GadC [Parendozoicomonas haliclonae]|uniref:Glutamate/gamma-aminobutyrate antiporter n=1 Tax=Parendozoicomonas haliclonae TaxID=1960125 RepID=A0A1X7AEJ2_9GAMM|nr:putative glutamine/gamma-aminobutyrate antiporter GadC [Parendozoicomonas haliclonae]SMA34694.1 Glutamate/gamma-aminobutyrate antiporter [Parendozoicomonas haliclonae]